MSNPEAFPPTNEEHINVLPLHVCPDCQSEFVQVVEESIEESGKDTWSFERWCPECPWEEEGTYHEDLCQDYDEQLDKGSAELAWDLVRLTSINMGFELTLLEKSVEKDLVDVDGIENWKRYDWDVTGTDVTVDQAFASAKKGPGLPPYDEDFEAAIGQLAARR